MACLHEAIVAAIGRATERCDRSRDRSPRQSPRVNTPLQSQIDRHSLSCKSISGLYDSISDVPDITSILPQPVNASTLSDFNLQSLFDSNPYGNDSHCGSLRNVSIPYSYDLSLNHQPLTRLTLSDFGLHGLFDYT